MTAIGPTVAATSVWRVAIGPCPTARRPTQCGDYSRDKLAGGVVAVNAWLLVGDDDQANDEACWR